MPRNFELSRSVKLSCRREVEYLARPCRQAALDEESRWASKHSNWRSSIPGVVRGGPPALTPGTRKQLHHDSRAYQDI